MEGILGDVATDSISRKRVRDEVKVSNTRKRPTSPLLRASTHKRAASIINGRVGTVPGDVRKGLVVEDDLELPESAGALEMMDTDSRMDLPSSPTTHASASLGQRHEAAAARADVDEDDVDEFAIRKPTAFAGRVASTVNLSASRPAPQDPRKPESSSPAPVLLSSDAIDASSWMDVNRSLNVTQSPTRGGSSKMDATETLETDGSMLFYWTDYLEINGILGLFGKVQNKKTGQYVSAYCRVDGIMRNLYFLPRDHRQSAPDTELRMADVHAEVSQIMRSAKIDQFKAKTSTRKYAFELPDIPQQSEYLKVLYSYKSTQLSMDLKGDTFSHVFGTNTAMFEQFVLYRRIMGPCWLIIKSPDLRAALNSSWCRVEVGVSDPENIETIPDLAIYNVPETPLVTLMSVSFRTILNKAENKSEIVVASARIYQDVNLEDPTPADKLPCQTFTIVRPLRNVFPNGFELEAKRQGLILERSETALLNAFMAKWQNVDADLIIGHDWENIHYGTLLARLKEKKISNWHRIGRMKRGEWPKIYGKGGFFAEKSLAVGRLMCDLSNDLGKSLMTKAQSWTLTELCKLELGRDRKDVDNEKALQAWTDTARGLVDFAMHCATDTYFQAAIAIKIQILPLSKQLTILAGNSWAATMSGTRAQRNEYILLHEFTKNKYICPDKVWQKSKTLEEDEDADLNAPAGKKKDKFKGGLVFEPEKGLYDKFILVMDFNSLYPSIIQEYNICFTTVERIQESDPSAEETVPDPPNKETPQGILPKIIANLVNRRRQVKSLLKSKDATEVQKSQWDTRQQALKLTANSMYGCLGYTKSRFYARPLAMLTTFKGREALTNTKELADSQDLQVIYGDTDSVMINTNADNYLDAIKIGNEFKKNVNDRYRLLEIDIDNIFQRMLLHAKKKYAALVLMEVAGKLEAKIEVKGLDMRRREYCTLAKEASQYCLDQILSGEQTDVVVENIHEYLRDFAEKMKNGEFPKHKFIILNKLGKEPESYPNGKTMPHVQVALKRKAKGDTIRANDVMQYIITGDSDDNRHVADRAYPASDVTRADSELTIDFNYYLAHQILPPLERLCAPIEGTDRTRIAECLGLDPSRYRIHEIQENATKELTTLEASISDEDRFSAASPLSLHCSSCRSDSTFSGVLGSLDLMTSEGLRCSCNEKFSQISMNAQLQVQIQAFITKYYQAWLICDDSQCQTRTQQCGVYGKRCLTGACRGEMQYEYTDKALYNQLLYFDHLFDADKARKLATGAVEERARALAEQNRARFETTRSLVASYLKKCGRRYVDMSNIFSYA